MKSNFCGTTVIDSSLASCRLKVFEIVYWLTVIAFLRNPHRWFSCMNLWKCLDSNVVSSLICPPHRCPRSPPAEAKENKKAYLQCNMYVIVRGFCGRLYGSFTQQEHMNRQQTLGWQDIPESLKFHSSKTFPHSLDSEDYRKAES